MTNLPPPPEQPKPPNLLTQTPPPPPPKKAPPVREEQIPKPNTTNQPHIDNGSGDTQPANDARESGTPRGVTHEENTETDEDYLLSDWPKPQPQTPLTPTSSARRLSAPPPPPQKPRPKNPVLDNLSNSNEAGNKPPAGVAFPGDDFDLGGPAQLVGFWGRVAYTLLDAVIIGLIFIPIQIFLISQIDVNAGTELSTTSDMSGTTAEMSSASLVPFLLSIVISAAVPFLYIFLLLGFFGATLGQKILNTEVVSRDSGMSVKGSWGRAFVRTIAAPIIAIVPFGSLLDYLWCIWDDNKQTLHDKVASTLVIYK